MSNHFSMGAINKLTNEYEYPKIAIKGKKYKCPECNKDVIFCKGKIKQPYFAHKKSESPCYYYDKPSESQIHKDAKYLLHQLLTNKTVMNFYNICMDCKEKVYGCCELFEDCYESNMEPIIEYKFEYNNSKKSADVALIKDNKIVYIFEICYKNKTREDNRPEPWVEIKAEEFIHDINNSSLINDKGVIEIECIRDSICDVCEEQREKDRIYWEEWRKQCELERKKFEARKKQEEEEKRHKKFIAEYKQKIYLEEQKIKRELEEKERQRLLEEKEKARKIYLLEHAEEIKLQQEEELKRQIYFKKLSEQDNRCDMCGINYCKCDNPNIIKINNISLCNKCNKRKCKCVKITQFFTRIKY
jgi:hypothetical protein